MEGFPLHPGASGPVFSKEVTKSTKEENSLPNFRRFSNSAFRSSCPLCAPSKIGSSRYHWNIGRHSAAEESAFTPHRKSKCFAEFILSLIEGLSMTSKRVVAIVCSFSADARNLLKTLTSAQAAANTGTKSLQPWRRTNLEMLPLMFSARRASCRSRRFPSRA
jgi:hypothetical protein